MLQPPLAASLGPQPGALADVASVAPLALLGLLYGRRARTLGRTPHSIPGWRQGCFYAGLGLIAVALLSPIGALSDELLSAHMVEHLLMGDLAALLIVLGLTGPLLAPVLRIAFFDRLRVLAHPLVALPLWAINLYVWHLPFFYQAARTGTSTC